MATTENTYTGDGSLKTFSFTFPYLEETDIRVSLDGSDTSAYSLANATTIQFNTAPSNGVAVRIYRVTDQTAPPTTFFAGSSIRAQDLNDNFLQTLYVAQETDAIARNLTAGDIAPGSITSLQLADLSVSTAKLVDDSVTSAKLATNSVGTDALYSNSSDINNSFRPVITDSIRNSAVTEAKIADDAVTADKIATDAVITAKIQNDAVTADKLKDSTTTDSDRAVTTDHIRDGAVTRAKTTDPGVALQVQRSVFTAADSAAGSTYTVTGGETTALTESQTKELMSVSITPKLATSKLLIQVHMPVVSGSTAVVTAGLFKDADGSTTALSVGQCTVVSTNYVENITFSHYMDAGSTASTTFSVRYGLNTTSGFTYINSVNGTDALYGGTCEASITVTEIAQ